MYEYAEKKKKNNFIESTSTVLQHQVRKIVNNKNCKKSHKIVVAFTISKIINRYD